jgi:hypothetical protein
MSVGSSVVAAGTAACRLVGQMPVVGCVVCVSCSELPLLLLAYHHCPCTSLTDTTTAVMFAALPAASVLWIWYDGALQPDDMLESNPAGGVLHEHSAAQPKARLLQV